MSADQDLAHGAEPVHGHPVATLVMRARNGDELAWGALVERYAPLIWSLCRRYRLDGAVGDVGQDVWLQLVNQLDKIRDPAALPGWLATTTRRECQRVLNRAPAPHAATQAVDADNIPDDQATMLEHVLAADRAADQGAACAVRPDQCQARHPCRQHRAEPPPLPGQAAPSSGQAIPGG